MKISTTYEEALLHHPKLVREVLVAQAKSRGKNRAVPAAELDWGYIWSEWTRGGRLQSMFDSRPLTAQKTVEERIAEFERKLQQLREPEIRLVLAASVGKGIEWTSTSMICVLPEPVKFALESQYREDAELHRRVESLSPEQRDAVLEEALKQLRGPGFTDGCVCRHCGGEYHVLDADDAIERLEHERNEAIARAERAEAEIVRLRATITSVVGGLRASLMDVKIAPAGPAAGAAGERCHSDGDGGPEMTARIDLLRHACGMDSGDPYYRDYYAAVPGSADDAAWAGLVSEGLASVRRDPASDAVLELRIYGVTKAGKALIAAYDPAAPAGEGD